MTLPAESVQTVYHDSANTFSLRRENTVALRQSGVSLLLLTEVFHHSTSVFTSNSCGLVLYSLMPVKRQHPFFADRMFCFISLQRVEEHFGGLHLRDVEGISLGCVKVKNLFYS